jgi:ABC-type dipeptide/oligopeptide/nickel transport system permease component/ABC-type transport system substrate-binding protein
MAMTADFPERNHEQIATRAVGIAGSRDRACAPPGFLLQTEEREPPRHPHRKEHCAGAAVAFRLRLPPVKRLIVIVGGLAAAAIGFTALIYACAAGFRPDLAALPPPPPAAQLAAVEEARRNSAHLDLEHPPVLVRDVDYAAGEQAAWWPKGEAPVLAGLVADGHLPRVAERTGPEPLVMGGVDGIGRYGGTWLRLVNSITDLSTIFWRLSDSNLVRWSPHGYPIVPHLAKSWQVSPDFKSYVFTLRRGVRWSDGVPFTSDDIVYWYENEIKYFNVQPRNLLRIGGSIGRVERIDEWHVRFVFDEPNPLFLERLASTSQNYEDFTEHIVPAHYLRRYHPALGDQELIRRTMEAMKLSSPVAVYRKVKDYMNPEHPRLWPWILHTYRPTPPQTFVRNPYYWAVDPEGNQLPYLDRLVMDIKTNNLIAVAAANGEPSMQDRHIRYEDHTLLLGNAAANGYEVYHWKPSTQSLFTIFPNLNRVVDPARPDTRWRHELLNDRRFRQALSLAIDRRAIIAAEFNGQGDPAQLAPPADSPYHSARLLHAFTEHDPARASRLLDELGLQSRDGEGFRTFPDGTRMTFLLNVTDYTIEGPAQFVIEDWAAVGVRVLLRSRSRRLFEQEKRTYEHDFTVWTSESEFYPLVEPRNFVPTYFESFYAPGFGVWYQNGGLYGNAAAQRPGAIEPPPGHPLRRAMELLDAANAMTSEAERIAQFDKIQEIAADEVWTISIATPPPQLVVVKNGFRNVPRTALFGANFQSPANTGIETYFWEKPDDDEATVAQTREAIVTVTPPPGSLTALKYVAPTPASHFWRLVRWALLLAVAGTVVVVGRRQPMIGRRVLLMVPTLLVVSIIVFTLVQLPPGDYAHMRIARLEMEGTPSNDELAAELRRNFHLDEPMLERYARWMGFKWFWTFEAGDRGLLQGDLGISMEQEKPVADVIGDRILLTVIVTLATVVFTWIVALPIGIYSAVRQYSAGDYVLTFIGFVGVSVPSFLLALVTLYAARRWLGWNIGGLFSPEFATMSAWTWPKVVDLLKHLWLPVVVLGVGSTAGMIRVMRANLLDELKKPYVTTARAKGLRPLRLLLKYPVRLALNPFVSSLGGIFPQLVSGGALVAMVLSLPMLGPTLFDALIAEDVYLAGSMLMLLSVLGMAGMLVSDLVLLWLDPRIRLTRTAP